jgi:hypothetical protein
MPSDDTDLESACRSLLDDGFVVLEQVVSHDHLACIGKRMLDDLDLLLREDLHMGVQFRKGHVQHDPPPFPPYLFGDILNNEAVLAVSLRVLGPGIRNVFYSGNTNLPGSESQPVHVDGVGLWPDYAHPPDRLVINVPVVDVGPENGAIELWPGTQLLSPPVQEPGLRVSHDHLESRRLVRPPVRAETRVGDVLIRDVRLWHRGVTNHTDRPRPMIAMIHVAKWLRFEMTTVFASGSEPYLENPLLTHQATFTAQPIDYLTRHGDFDVRAEE